MICPQCGTQLVSGTPFCTTCGHQFATTPPGPPPASQWAPTWDQPQAGAPKYAPPPPTMAQPEFEYVAYGSIEFVSPMQTMVDPDASAPARPPTMIERLLGGNWLTPFAVASPAFAAVVVAAALAATSQLLIGPGDDRIPIFTGFARSTGAWFHTIPQIVAMGFGSPIYVHEGSVTISVSVAPMLVPTLAVIVFAYLLRRRLTSPSTSERLVFALRAAIVMVVLLVIVSFIGTWTSKQEGFKLHLAVSPGRVLAWSALVFVTTAVIVAVRPLELIQRHASGFVAAEWRPAVRGAFVTTATAISLGFTGVVAAAFAQWHNKADVARLLPSALANSVNLGIDGWHFSMLGSLRDTTSLPHQSLSLFDHHTLSLFYFGTLALPVLSIIAGALTIRRAYPLLDRQMLSRSCYRMTWIVLALYVVLAIPSQVRTHQGQFSGSGQFGPQVLIGAALVLAWYLVAGFAVGRVVARRPRVVPVTEMAHAPSLPGEPDELALAPRRRVRRVFTPITIGVACVLLIGAAGAGAAIEHGGKNAPAASGDGVQSIPPQEQPSGQFTDPSTQVIDPATEDSDAQQTLTDLASAEQDYYTQNGAYTADDTQLFSYVEPGDVIVTVDFADDTSFCADAQGVDSGNDFIYDSTVGSVEENGTC